jgi:hypothetical protein
LNDSVTLNVVTETPTPAGVLVSATPVPRTTQGALPADGLRIHEQASAELIEARPGRMIRTTA